MDQSALFTIPYGVYILTTEYEGKKNGCVINTLGQVTDEPIRVSFTVLKDNLTHELVCKSNKCSLSILSKKASLDIIKKFGYISGRETDKFKDMEYSLDQLNNPVIEKECVATICCKVTDKIDLDTHTLFICDVVDAKKLNNEKSMTYSDYRDIKSGKGLKEEDVEGTQKEEKPIYECKVCHYIYDGDIPFEDLPDDYICPVCKKPKSVFVRQN